MQKYGENIYVRNENRIRHNLTYISNLINAVKYKKCKYILKDFLERTSELKTSRLNT